MQAEATTLIPESADTADEALFASTESALKFAFAMWLKVAPPDTLSKYMKPRIREADEKPLDMTPTEMAGEAGNIRCRLAKFDPVTRRPVISDVGMWILTVKFGPKTVICNCGSSCCAGWVWTQEWAEAARNLCHRSPEAVSGHLTPFQFRLGAIHRWAGEKVNIGDLSDKCGIERHTGGRHCKAIAKWLNGGLKMALEQADVLLR